MNNKSIGRILMMLFAILFVLGINAGIMYLIGIASDIIILDILVKSVYTVIVFGIFHIINTYYEIYNK